MREQLTTTGEDSSTSWAGARIVDLAVQRGDSERAEIASARTAIMDLCPSDEPSNLMCHEIVDVLVEGLGFSSDSALQALAYHVHNGTITFAS